MSPDNSHLHRNLANALCDLGRFPEAEPHVRRALVGGYDDLKARQQLHTCCLYAHRTEEALENAQILVKRTDGKSVAALRLLAHTHLRLQEPEKARQALGRALEVDPEDRGAAFLLSVLDNRVDPAGYLDYTQSSYDNTAQAYDDVIAQTLQNRVADLLIELLLVQASSSMPFRLAVDLGCGGGRMGKLLAPICDRLVGVDLSPRMIELCHQRDIYDELHVADLSQFPHDLEASADLFVCSDALIHVGDLGPFFANCRACSQPGGKLLFSIERYDGNGLTLDVPTLRYLHSQAYVERTLAEHGYDIIEIRQDQIRVDTAGAVAGLLVLCEVRD